MEFHRKSLVALWPGAPEKRHEVWGRGATVFRAGCSRHNVQGT
ncbi:MAG: hypothetical protein ACREBA_10790 [Nitrosotalea sp.]